MSRLPLEFAGRPITFRVPYTMPGEVTFTENQSGQQFPENQFIHNEDKPFEIHRILIDCTAFTQLSQSVGGGFVMLDPQPETCNKRFKLKITDFSKSEFFDKNPAFPLEMTWANTLSWEFEDPYTLVRGEGLMIQVDTFSYDYRRFDTGQEPVTIDQIRIEVGIQGYKIVIAPPSETR